MRTRWILASTLLISSCALVKPTSFGASLILKPQIEAGSYTTKTVVNPYTQASINHLILKLYTVDGTEHDQGIQKSIPNVDLGKSIAFSNLKANTTYRIKAYAYFTADQSQPISTNDANCYTDVSLTNNDQPAIAPLKVKLINIAFNGQGTGSLQVTNGGYNYAASESLTIPCTVGTFAGGAGGTSAGFTNGQGTAARFITPWGVTTDGSGNVYIADSGNQLIRKITSSGNVTTFAGQTGAAGYADGTSTAAKFYTPWAVAADSSGNVYVAEYTNCLIRKITSDGVVSTIAGQVGVAGYADGTGTSAKFDHPRGITVDGSGNVYVSDTNNQRIRKITSSGVVSTLAGGADGTNAGYADGQGTSAKFNGPYGIVLDGSGNLYIAERNNNLIRKVTSAGLVSTIAGGAGGTTLGAADGTGTAATFTRPEGITIDFFGNLLVADSGNNRIRKISNGVVTTLAGQAGFGYQDGDGSVAKFYDPTGIAVDWAGNVYIADYFNNLIRVLK